MPWRLLIFIVIGAVLLGFIGFNLEVENRCDVSLLWFYTFHQVPIFLSTLFAFVLGMVLAFPLAISFRSAGRRKDKIPPAKDSGKKKAKTGEAALPSPGGDYGID
jgi:uncharacterized integral membrane protein